MKTLDNIDVGHKNETEVGVFGDPSKWVCISKAWCKAEGWMKSTKAMNTGKGCLVQVSTQQGDNVAEALTYVPDCSAENLK